MFSLFIVLLSFISSLAREAKVSDQTKCLFLNDEPCMLDLLLLIRTMLNLNMIFS